MSGRRELYNCDATDKLPRNELILSNSEEYISHQSTFFRFAEIAYTCKLCGGWIRSDILIVMTS